MSTAIPVTAGAAGLGWRPQCCPLSPCRLLCGALFHLCKEEEHLLLCPNVRVPCLNAEYGCPVQLPRSSRAAHLQMCPASVVCCSMEWLRWPTDETQPHGFKALQDKVLEECAAQDGALDVAMSLVDQSDLYERLKMKPLYPELMEEDEEEMKEEERQEAAAGWTVEEEQYQDPSEGLSSKSALENKDVEEVEQNSSKPGLVINKEAFNLMERMFSMEKGGCTVAQEKLENQTQTKPSGEKGSNHHGRDPGEPEMQDKANAAHTNTAADASAAAASEHDTSRTGLAPWQEGVLGRLGQELTPQEYNMYLVHHGRMLLAFGQIEACTPREKDFVYGSLEPIVPTDVPDSYHYRQRVHKYDKAARAQTEHCSVDTSDLEASEDTWFTDEAATTLLGYAEQAVMGHKISETKGADGLYVDVGTQTHSFRSAPFKRKTTLAEVMAGRPLKLHLQLQAESVNSRNNQASCAFTFICGHTFHRKEYSTHFRNVHSDIQTGLSGWFEQRCPLSYLGCTYSQRRFQPLSHEATVTYNQQLKCFNLRPTNLPGSPSDSSSAQDNEREHLRGDSLSSLPFEVLCHMATFLDSLSLCQLALVSRLMRQVCFSLLHERGMVTLRWRRKTCTQGRFKWEAKPVWEFSHLFSSVDSWRQLDIPPMSAHLKVCPYYQTSTLSEPIALPNMSEKERNSKKSQSLVNHFNEKL
ncbi:hypothetical protein OJAV_G00142100 [Oryzias javanicus]|uniref:F-box domain-containing protein n=1 Tax=Oryzias javanicus TaxID=123683 RepID=A0A437CN68_ORYJA|nr:hypothetical protein OJAV_G00142100 [Oryzias javanicus]